MRPRNADPLSVGQQLLSYQTPKQLEKIMQGERGREREEGEREKREEEEKEERERERKKERE